MLKYVGNLDLHTIWERAARRAGLPLAYTQGFHPQPKINLAAPLPLGFTSRCEVVDLRLNEEVDLANLHRRLQGALPAGIGILNVESIAEHTPALQTQVVSAEYEVSLKEDVDGRELKDRLEGLLARASLPRQRRGKDYDLRPLIEALSTSSDDKPSDTKIYMRLAAREGATGRPEEVLDALGIALEDTSMERTRLIFQG